MKPLNLDNKPCSPISSSCVIWQGPDIECINLCKGDTVSSVVAALADELCCVLTTLNVNSYDLSCFNINQSKPEDFKAFMQFLLEKICTIEGLDHNTVLEQSSGDCPTGCVVTVATPFQTSESKTMNLVDYTLAIGNKVTLLITDINLNKSGIANHETRIVALELAPAPTFTLPSISPNCVLPNVPTPIDQVLQALEASYCSFLSSTGTGAQLIDAVSRQCSNLGVSPSKVNPSNGMSVEYAGTWINSATTLADSVNNLWITLCDLRDAQNVTLTKTDTDTIQLTLSAGPAYNITADLVDTGWQALEGFQYYPGSITKPQVRRIGKVLHFRGNVIVPLSSDGGATIVPLLASTSYYNETYIAPYTGASGGVTLNPAGSIIFNNNLNVIPTSVLDSGTLLDSTYTQFHTIATRPINLDATYGTALTAHGALVITSDKKLVLATLKDVEITSTRPAGWLGSSPLRLVTSNVRVGEYVPNYIDVNTDIQNAPTNADFPLTSGTRNTVWPFSCDAGEETDIGGFVFTLDGLIAYI